MVKRNNFNKKVAIDYETKYKNALERAKAWNRNELSGTRKEMTEYIFPELKESEDEKIINNLRTCLHCGKTHGMVNDDEYLVCKNYLEKQKEQKPIVLSDKFEIALEEFLMNARDASEKTFAEDVKMYADRLRGIALKEQKSAEWSEEDEKKLYQIIETLLADKEIARQVSPQHYDVLCKAYDELISWLKSLRPQPQWKPSEEQIYSLGTVVKGYDECNVGSVGYNLKGLYEQLKRIKENKQ